MKKIFNLIILAIAALGLVSFRPAPALASDVCNANVDQAIKDAAGCNSSPSEKDRAADLIVNIINWVMGIIGFIAVIAIIISGIQFISSGGDAAKVKKARDALLYSVIGLVVVILSAAIVNLVIKGVIEGNTSTPPTTEETTETTLPPVVKPPREETCRPGTPGCQIEQEQ